MKILLLLLLTFCGWISIGADFSPPYVRDKYNPPFEKRSVEQPSVDSCLDECSKEIFTPGPVCIIRCNMGKRSVEEGSDDDTCMADCKKKGLSWNVCIRGCPKPGKRSVQDVYIDCMNSCPKSWMECSGLKHCGKYKRSVVEGSEAANDNCKKKCKDDGNSEDTCQRECFGSPGKRSVEENKQDLCKAHCGEYGSKEECDRYCGGGKIPFVEGSNDDTCISNCELKGIVTIDCVSLCKPRVAYEENMQFYCDRYCSRGDSRNDCKRYCPRPAEDYNLNCHTACTWSMRPGSECFANCQYDKPSAKKGSDDEKTCMAPCKKKGSAQSSYECYRNCYRGKRSVEEGSEESKKNQQ